MQTAYERIWDHQAWELDRVHAQVSGGGGKLGQAQGTDLPQILTDEDLDEALLEYFGVRLPNLQCCEHHRTPWEAFHDAFFARSPVTVWKASRGFGGKSFTLSLLGLVEALFLRADVNVLGGSGEQSKRVLEAMSKLWAHPSAPKQCLIGDPGAQKQRMAWGNRIVALMASQASVRGPHPQRLRMDEVDEMDLKILDSALGQPMSRGSVLSQVVLSSTHQYADGTMTQILKRARTGGWPIFEWCYRENLEPHGWLTQAEVDRKRAILTQAMWDTEIELQEPSSEGRAIDTDRVEAAFRSDLPLSQARDKAARYGTGADWAKKKNWTVIVTIRADVRPMQVVKVKRTQKEPWPAMAGYLDAQVREFQGPDDDPSQQASTHDNTGLGQVVHDLLTTASEPFNMVGRDRQDLLSEYVAAIEKGELVWPKADDADTSEAAKALQAAYSEHKYATRDDLYKGTKDGSGKHHLPDTISAGALAYRAAKQAPAASSMGDPHPDTAAATPHLQNPAQRGRLSGYIMGARPGRPLGRGGR